MNDQKGNEDADVAVDQKSRHAFDGDGDQDAHGREDVGHGIGTVGAKGFRARLFHGQPIEKEEGQFPHDTDSKRGDETSIGDDGFRRQNFLERIDAEHDADVEDDGGHHGGIEIFETPVAERMLFVRRFRRIIKCQKQQKNRAHVRHVVKPVADGGDGAARKPAPNFEPAQNSVDCHTEAAEKIRRVPSRFQKFHSLSGPLLFYISLAKKEIRSCLNFSHIHEKPSARESFFDFGNCLSLRIYRNPDCPGYRGD